MKQICKIAGAVVILSLMFIADIPYLSENLVPEAQALRGRGAAFAVGAAAGSASASSASAPAPAATSQPQAAAPPPQAAAPQPPPAASGQPLPLGTVVSALPAGCVATPVGGENYYYCGGNFYQAKYQGSNLVYVTTKPK
jgi:hypothetical protein